MIDLIKLLIHCNYHLIKNIKEDHRMCEQREFIYGVKILDPKTSRLANGNLKTRHFCTCGYLNNGVKFKDILK